MPAVAILGSRSAGHCFNPRPTGSGNPANVLVGGIPAHVVGGAWPPHKCGKAVHASVTSQGSPTVFIGGLPVARVGDSLSCGDRIASGSPTVFIN